MKPYENQMPSGVDSFVEESSKEEVKAPSNVEKEYKNLSGEAVKTHLNGQKLSPEKQTRYDQVKGEMSKLAKVPADKGGLKQPKPTPKVSIRNAKPTYDPKDEDSIWDSFDRKEISEKERNRLLSERTKGLIDEKPIGTLNKEKGYYEYDKPFLKADIKSDADIIAEHTNKTQPSNVVTYGNSSKFLEKYGLDKYFEFDGMDLVDKRDYSTTAINFGRNGKSEEELLNEIKKYYPNLSKKKENSDLSDEMKKSIVDDVWSKYSRTPKEVVAKIAEEENYDKDRIEERLVNDPNVIGSNNYTTDEELKEELVDNKYYYENARSEEEIAKWLAERQDIPYDRALAFVKANYKGGEIWSEGKTYEPFDKYEDDIRAKAKEVSDSMKSIGYYNLDDKDELEQAYQDLAYDLKEQFPMVDPKEIEKYVAEEGINLY